MQHLSSDELHAGLEHIRQAPGDEGPVELIVRRPAVDAREVLDEAVFDLTDGLVGDTWKSRGSSRTPDRRAHPTCRSTSWARG